jgi:uncharacterized lipoprotein YddW (UPF0748 family)
MFSLMLLPILMMMPQQNASPSAPQIQPPPPASREFRAAWVATVDNIDWPSKRGLSTKQQQDELIRIFDIAQQLNFNAIILQVRPHADALYESALEPWSEYLTGQQGKRPEPYYDPLEFAIQEARKRGMELHAWFNPYRAWHPAAKGSKAANYIGRTHPHLVRKYGNFEWLDPGEKEVQDWSHRVMMDVVRRYDVDGIHIDDYFYPYPVRANNRTVPFPDDRSWSAYLKSGGGLSRNDWRRDNVNKFVERFYKALKHEKPHVKFGISPFGIYRPGVPKGIQAGIDQYDHLFADVRKWMVNGWCDYLTPQLYWPIAKKEQSYPVLMDWWAAKEQNPKGRHLWIGNMSSNLSVQNWAAKEILDQVELTRKHPGATGNVFFSMKTFTLNYKSINAPLAKLNETPALIPASPWLGAAKPQAPQAQVQASSGPRAVSLGDPCKHGWQWAIYERRNGRWRLTRVMPAQAGPLSVPQGADAIAVSAISRTGIESDRTVLGL